MEFTNPEKINARREEVLDSYNSAKSSNRRQYIDGNDRATAEYIYPNQMKDANDIVDQFYRKNKRVVSVMKKTKVGADGLMIEIAKLMTTHSDDDFVVNSKNVRILTGMSNAGWERDMKEKSPGIFKDKVFHHGKLSRAELREISNGLIIIDEIDTGDKEFQVLHNTLKDAGVLDVKHMKRNNNRFVLISATMMKELYELYRWGDLHELFYMSIPPGYIGHKDFLIRDIIQEFYPLSSNDAVARWLKEDIIENYGNDFRVHIVRVTNKTVQYVQYECIRAQLTFRNHTASDRLTDDEINEFFREPLSNHIVVAVKGFFRRANLIPNQWKKRIGATHEHYTKKIDNSVQVQGLPGRMTGYWSDTVKNGFKTGPHRTSVQAIKEYETCYLNPFGTNSYQTAGFSKKNGVVRTKNKTLWNPDCIDNLQAVDGPHVDRHSDKGITELFDCEEALHDFMQGRRTGNGSITTYNLVEDVDVPSIHYRGSVTTLYVYETSSSFENFDIYGGINNEIICRKMPVLHRDQIKWIGIYVKRCFDL